MGAGQSDLYKGTYGDNPDNIPDELKQKVKLPDNDAQLKHIFRDAEGHLPDSPENRKLLQELANDKSAHMGKDSRGLDWHVRMNADGSQTWVSSINGVIQNDGVNNPPHAWDASTGLSRNLFKGRKKHE